MTEATSLTEVQKKSFADAVQIFQAERARANTDLQTAFAISE